MAAQGIDELKALVTETLKKRGVLGKFKAQLRKTVISVLDADSNQTLYAENPKAAAICSTDEGLLLAELIREYLQFYDLEYAESVFVPEASLPATSSSRAQLAATVCPGGADASAPLLAQVLACVRKLPGATTTGENGRQVSSLSAGTADKHYEEMYEKDEFETTEDPGTPLNHRPVPSIKVEKVNSGEPFASNAPRAALGPPLGGPPNLSDIDRDDDASFSDHSATQSEVDDMIWKYDFTEDIRAEGPRAPPPGGDSDSDHF
eukprot:GGOE01000826.1.p1 GENE.GGOE01000826.1~~GGOE01000826.1.p1  ORF type:complete len:263 (-),score=40.59 GGOE01000826.1:477-1265(-)